MNKIGWCAGIEQAGLLADIGLDYIECALSSLQLEEEEAFAGKLALYLSSPVKVRAMNLFAPADMMLIGPQRDGERIRKYVSLSGEAAARIGAGIVVLGSGRARMVPDGWERRRAEAEMLECLGRIADEWRGSGVTLAIEPLNHKESNLINSVAEAASLAKQVNSPAVRILADLYHMDEEDEPLETLAAHKEWIAHIHVADTGRLAPGTGTYPYEQFAGILREIGYEGMVSAECKWPDTVDGVQSSISFMQQMFDRKE
ncbi:sugar phosphate isomerase/epimerase family protein [Paenibacillus harenae]|uniref:sugar phosphate isomerase/epimerase family protein n=1 Tax=Paenibacillus harenae TaxID=306543 RepID=UPI000402AE0B|nr:sugar phosphate isomerase/epimerase family protein [Paenibacillus harenae]